MGIIAKQSIIGSIFIYAGAFIGLVNNIILFPVYLSQDQIGLINLLVTYSVLFSHIAGLGLPSSINRIFPHFRNKEQKHNGFFIIIMRYIIAGIAVVTIAYYAIMPFVLHTGEETKSMFDDFAFLILPLVIFTQLFNVFDSYTKSLYNATRGIILKEFILRLCILVAIVCYSISLFNFNWFVYLYVSFFCLIALFIFVSLVLEKNVYLIKPTKAIYTKKLRTEMFSLSVFGILASSLSILTLYIDKVMLQNLIDGDFLSQIGIYSTCSFIATVIVLPSRPLLKISTTICAEAWKENDLPTIGKVYRKSTKTQLIVALFIFIAIWVNIDDLLSLMSSKEDYSAGKWVVFFLGLFFIADMSSGISHIIIGTSKNYKALTVLMTLLLIFVVASNFALIPFYGITGAAVASFVSKLLFNFVKWWYVKRQFKMQPYNMGDLKAIALAVVAFIAVYLLPNADNIYVNIFLKLITVTLIYLPVIYILKISEDINAVVDRILSFIGISLNN